MKLSEIINTASKSIANMATAPDADYDASRLSIDLQTGVCTLDKPIKTMEVNGQEVTYYDDGD